MILYRPVGVGELKMIAESGYTAFPPRMAHQPIFYPVLTHKYAEQIALEWNTKDVISQYAGFVTQFELDDAYANQFPVHVVGSRDLHREIWVPAEELEFFNGYIVGKIEVIAAFYGSLFEGEVDPETNLPIFDGV